MEEGGDGGHGERRRRPPRPWTEAFAPATVSNLGPGFDCLGLALRGPGDVVRVRINDHGRLRLVSIEGDEGRLPREIDKNTATVAIRALLEHYPAEPGLDVALSKGLPLGSGLGSSGASACAAVVAADAALGLNAGRLRLIEAARVAENVACGSPHADNVAPAIVGGIVLIPALDPLNILELPIPEDLWLSLYTPGCEVPTATARAVLPAKVPLGQMVKQAARMGMLVNALHREDLYMLGESIVDEVVEPARARLVPGFLDAKTAVLEAGALACSISGAGPTTFALTDSKERATALLGLLDEAFCLAGVGGRGYVDQVGPGARVTSPRLH